MESQKLMVRKISVSSAFQVGLVLNALLFAVFGIPFLFVTALMGNYLVQQGQPAGAADMGLVGGIFFYLIGVVASGIGGGIGFAIQAFLYNIVAAFVGGLEVEIV